MKTTIVVDAYNVAVQLATVEYRDPATNSFIVDPNNIIPKVAKKVVDVGRVAFTGSHQNVPGSYAAESALRETTTGQTPMLDQLLKTSTVFLSCTHGENTYFRSSQIDELFGNEVTQYVQD